MAELPIATQCGTGAPAPLPLWIPAFAGMTNSVAGTIHPGSESGTCFRTNDTHETGPP